jgi:tetratricopeptide (TPR) repeat protein
MKKTIFTGILAVAAGCGTLLAQPAQVQQAAPAAPQAGPKVKSKAEADAVQALFNARSAGPDAIIKAADDLVSKFADTDFKEIAYTLEATAYEQKSRQTADKGAQTDAVAKAEFYDEEVLKINPKSADASMQLGELIINHTGENDLDKEEKLAKAEKLLNQSIDSVKAATKPNPQITDAQWEGYKKGSIAQAQSDLGRLAMLRKKYDDAITQYKAAYDSSPEPAFQAYLAQAYQKAGKNDEALALCDKMLGDAQLNPAIKQYVQNVQRAATAAKGAK